MGLKLDHFIRQIPMFMGADSAEVCEILREYDAKHFEPGEFICRQGEYDENCNVILDGEASVLVIVSKSDVPRRIKLGKGEIFGEIAAMSGTPRTADVVADTPLDLLNISRDRLFKILDKFPVIKERLDATYRARALSTHLGHIPVFSGLSKEFLEQLKDKVSLLTYKKDEVVFKQGADGDAFYLIRYGFVKVTQTDAKGNERVIAYLNEGSYFGEIALLGNEKRSATVSALNRVEIIKVAKEDFEAILAHQPTVRSALHKVIQKRLERNEQVVSSTVLAQTLAAVVEEGVIQSKAVLIMDTSKCVHCDNCVKACADLHDGYSRLIRRGLKFNDFIMLPTSCRNCQDPVCMTKCPTGAIRRDLTGEIYHQDNCIGCGSCARLCPHGNISIVTLDETAIPKVEKIPLFSRLLKPFRSKREETGQTIPPPPSAGSRQRTSFPGERVMTERPETKKFPGELTMAASKEASAATDEGGKKPKKARRRAAKCDMCRQHDFMGCVYNCPTGAARRVDPTEYFAELKTVG